LADGCKEIWLTSQDCAAYGLDANTNLSKLLEKICKIPGDFHIRVGMGNPNHIIKILPELIEAYKNKKVFKFLHIPIQSGNDRVLKLMNRFYTVGDFKKIVKEFRKQITNLTLITDIICGFPTETEKEFEDSVKLITWLQPDAINVSMFWPRPGTIAEKMKQLSGEIKKKRSREMTKLYHSVALDVNKKLVGKKFKVLVDEIGKKGGFVARNESYKPIVLKESKLKLGDSPQVRIISATKNYLIGEI
jgi:MiaB/RimO family radical SAM methylthiotransferase